MSTQTALRSACVALVLAASTAVLAQEPATPPVTAVTPVAPVAPATPTTPTTTQPAAVSGSPEAASQPAAVSAAPAPGPATAESSTPPPAARTEESPEALLAELDSAEGDAGELSTPSDENPQPVQLYGFADIGYRHLFVDDDNPWLLFLNRHPSLFVGNLNVYLDAQIASRWRALFEVRLTYLPHGAPITDFQDDTIERESARTADYNDFTRSKNLGGLMIERAQVEYAAFEFLTFKAGQFLTPYGIWNVDHGSPVIIGVSRPFIIGSELLPEHQVGLMAEGSTGLGGDFELGYMLALSNGRTDFVAYEDLDGNKAVTARASLSYRGAGQLTLGSTFYAGRYTESLNQLYFEGPSPKSRERIDRQFDEVSYAFDLLFRYEGLLLQSEWIVNDRAYTKHGRPPGPNGGLRPDKRNWGGYGLLGYRTPWITLMPYVKAEYSPEPQSQSIGVADQIMILTAGLNLRPWPAVVFKTEFVYGHFTDGDPKGFAGNDIQGVDFQLAFSF